MSTSNGRRFGGGRTNGDRSICSSATIFSKARRSAQLDGSSARITPAHWRPRRQPSRSADSIPRILRGASAKDQHQWVSGWEPKATLATSSIRNRSGVGLVRVAAGVGGSDSWEEFMGETGVRKAAEILERAVGAATAAGLDPDSLAVIAPPRNRRLKAVYWGVFVGPVQLGTKVPPVQRELRQTAQPIVSRPREGSATSKALLSMQGRGCGVTPLSEEETSGSSSPRPA